MPKLTKEQKVLKVLRVRYIRQGMAVRRLYAVLKDGTVVMG